MRLKQLYLKNFRNYKEVEVAFCADLNVFYGDNAQGKTNLLEAIYLLITGRSFRTQQLCDLIRWQTDGFFISATLEKDEVDQTIELSFDGQQKRVSLNGSTLPSFATMLGMVQGVLFAPQDLRILTGTPQDRRRFIDLHLAQLDSSYVYHLGRYTRALRQRNALLRQKQTATLSQWEAEMSQAADYIVTRRKTLLADLKEPLKQAQQALGGEGDRIEITFRPSISDNFAEIFAQHRIKELDMGYTLSGPHRDDFTITLQGKEARLFGSEGQLRSAAMSLRLAEWEQLVSHTETDPLKLVDDVGANLDNKRRTKVHHQLLGPGQTFLTTPLPPDGRGEVFHVIDGTITV